MRVVSALTGNACTLIASDLVQMQKEGGPFNEGQFHGEIGEQVEGSQVPGEQWKDYHVTAAGEIRVDFINCGISLVDVGSASDRHPLVVGMMKLFLNSFQLKNQMGHQT